MAPGNGGLTESGGGMYCGEFGGVGRARAAQLAVRRWPPAAGRRHRLALRP